MPELLGATNPVPSYERNVEHRSEGIQNQNTKLENVQQAGRVGRADGRTEQNQRGYDKIRYDSNFQSFLQRLRESPNLAQSLQRLYALTGERVIESGLEHGVAAQMAKALALLHMDEQELLAFLKDQTQGGNQCAGPLFALLRSTYAEAATQGERRDILQFVKAFLDFNALTHIENNLLRNLQGMADAMPASWGEQLEQLLQQLERGIAAGDRQGNLTLLKKGVFPHMSAYVDQTHDMGLARGLLSMLALDVARYENADEQTLLRAYHQMASYGALKEKLSGLDDDAVLAALREANTQQSTRSTQFADALTAAAQRALRGEGSGEVQEIFKQLVNAMLVNQSVYMPLKHYLVPLVHEGRHLFSELWVDPDDQQQGKNGQSEYGAKLLLKLDVQEVGAFDIILRNHQREVSLSISCPARLCEFSKEMEKDIAQILTRNDLVPKEISVQQMQQGVTLTEVFPKLLEGAGAVNVKI